MLPDCNGDGVPDVIAGSHKDDTNGLDSGTVRVHSGIDGTILYSYFGDAAQGVAAPQVGQRIPIMAPLVSVFVAWAPEEEVDSGR